MEAWKEKVVDRLLSVEKEVIRLEIFMKNPESRQGPSKDIDILLRLYESAKKYRDVMREQVRRL